MRDVPADHLINIIKGLVSTERDADLAKVLGVGKSTIASWRKRGAIPENVLDRATAEFGLSDEVIARHMANEEDTSTLLLGVAVCHAILRFGQTLEAEEVSDYAGKLHRRKSLLMSVLRKAAVPNSTSMGADAIPVLSKVMDGHILPPAEVRRLLDGA